MAQYYTDQDRIDAQTMRIEVSEKPKLILAWPREGLLSNILIGLAESKHCRIRIHTVPAPTTIREAGTDATPYCSGKDIHPPCTTTCFCEVNDMSCLTALSFDSAYIVNLQYSGNALTIACKSCGSQLRVCHLQHLEYPQEYQQYTSTGQPVPQPTAASSVQQPQVC